MLVCSRSSRQVALLLYEPATKNERRHSPAALSGVSTVVEYGSGCRDTCTIHQCTLSGFLWSSLVQVPTCLVENTAAHRLGCTGGFYPHLTVCRIRLERGVVCWWPCELSKTYWLWKLFLSIIRRVALVVRWLTYRWGVCSTVDQSSWSVFVNLCIFVALKFEAAIICASSSSDLVLYCCIQNLSSL